MSDHADAARRRELQRRAFAAGGGLTAEEAGELRMLSAPAPARTDGPPAVTQAAPTADAAQSAGEEPPGSSEPVPASEPVSEPVSASESVSASGPETTPGSEPETTFETTPESAAAASPPRRRALAVVITVAALLLGIGVGWVSSPRSVHTAPAMTAEQQKADAEIVASGDFDSDSVRFRGEKNGAALWSATRDAQPCVILSVDGRRSSGCSSPSQSEDGMGFALAQLHKQDGDRSTSFTGYLVQTLSGEWAPVVNSMQMVGADWEGQYTQEELALIDILEQAGLHGSELQILGYDGDIPVWSTYGPDRCMAVVDPATSVVQKHCTGTDSDTVLEITLHGSVYQVVWSDRRGPTLTILRAPASIVCDADSGYCASADDTTGEIG